MTEAVLYGPATLGRHERELLALVTSEANGADYSAATTPPCSSSAAAARTEALATGISSADDLD